MLAMIAGIMDTAIIQYVQGKMAFEIVTTQQWDRWEVAFEAETEMKSGTKLEKQKVRRGELEALNV